MNNEELVSALYDKLDETQRALVSEELIAIKGAFRNQETELLERQEAINKLKSENDEILKVNGRLFQQVGFNKPEEQVMSIPNQKQEEPKIDLASVIDEKGNIID